MEITFSGIVGIVVVLVGGGICIGTRWGDRIPFIKKLAK